MALYALGSPTTGTVTISDAVPTVSVVAFDATAPETGPDLGTFRFTRTGTVTSSLTVTLTDGATYDLGAPATATATVTTAG
ncbi:MAG: hypothetical protein EXQ50_14245 [Acidobacteria bacterium]|nr:hypothetical protein [Acidobacteriota bacterium]MSO63221.1 hypothetical protein [Acidobacteriota bacterium]